MRQLIGAMTIALGMGLSGMASAVITGSSHDFTDGLKGKSGSTGAGTVVNENWNARKEICRVCHVPHDHSQAAKRYEKGLLWNHELSSANYTMYNKAWSSSIDGVQSAQPDGTSKLCLGCHDGTVGIDTFDKYAGSGLEGGAATIFFDGTDIGYSKGYKVPGYEKGNVDLTGTHPISITFPAGQNGTQFRDPDVATWIGGGTVASTLDNGKVQCSTCHDVHNSESATALGSHLLRQAQTVSQGGVASGLCLTCHLK